MCAAAPRRWSRTALGDLLVADVSEGYSFLKNLTEDERVLSADQHKKEERRYEVCRSAVREMDPVTAEPSSTGATAMSI
jgi:hypothetical protein